ncbi:MAG: hypothetical protein BWK79_16095 [Beggiatoa sp. IS2]|nr:MAG: hypothetical protein BWK79_16095 [Beggiatoa sp. IS2]
MLIYPTLDLFSYDIRESLGLSEAEIDKKRQYFKNRLPVELGQTIDKFDDQGEYVELLGKNGIHKFENAVYTGYYYPVRLNDSYGLLLDCSCRDQQSSDNLQWVSGLKQVIEQKSAQKATLGQTWVFYASVLNVPLEEYDLIAQKCYRALLPDANWHKDKTGSSEFSSGRLFELWRETGEMEHIVIILFSNEKSAENLMRDFIQDELRWFWYRHKITWAYAQSQDLKGILKAKSAESDSLWEDFSNRKFDISVVLEKANTNFRYHLELLNGLAIQIPTIETNLLNYRRLTGKLAQKLPGLNFPNEFERRTTEKYLLQIQRDQATFTLQLDLIKNIVASIQAQETHRNVEHIAAVQTKVEWLEVFFISFYAAEFTHLMVELSHEKDSSEMWIIAFTAVWAGLVAFVGLKLSKHLKIDKHFWQTAALGIGIPLIWFLYWCVK